MAGIHRFHMTGLTRATDSTALSGPRGGFSWWPGMGLHPGGYVFWCLVSSCCYGHRTFPPRRRLWNDHFTHPAEKVDLQTLIFYGSQAAHLLPSILKIGVTLKEEESRTWLVANCKGLRTKSLSTERTICVDQLLIFTSHQPPNMWCRMPKDSLVPVLSMNSIKASSYTARSKCVPKVSGKGCATGGASGMVEDVDWYDWWRKHPAIWCSFQRSCHHFRSC